MSVATVRRVVCRMGPGDPQTDAELVAAIAPAGAEREAAFVELLGRYGSMVLGVCRRVLGDAHDAEDAFQAVFLVLARKAGTIRPPGAVAGWLYGVAVRTAQKAKTAAARRRRREMATAEAGRVREPVGSPVEDADLRAVIDAELAALPESQRAAVVLCDLHGKTRAEAAAELNRPEGTVAAWLARGRKALAARLARRGVTLPAAGLVAVVTPAAVSANLASKAAAIFLGRSAPAGVLALAAGVMKGLSSASTKLVTGVVAVGALLVAVATAAAWHTVDTNAPLPGTPVTAAAPPPKPEPDAKAPADPKGPVAWKETKVLSLAGWIAGSAIYSPDGKTLFVSGTNAHVKAYDTTSWKLLWEYECPTSCPTLAVSPDGKSLAVTFKDADRRWGVRLINAATGKEEHTLDEGGVPGMVAGPEPYAVGFFPDTPLPAGEGEPPLASHKLIFGTAGGYVVKTWIDPQKPGTITSSTVEKGKAPADTHAVPLAVDPEGKRVVVTGPIDKDTGTNVLWAWAAGSGAGNKLLEGHKARVVCAAWSKNGKVIATGDDSGVVIVWDATTFKEKSRAKIGGRVAAVAVSPDGMGIAASAIRPTPKPVPGQAGCTGDVFMWLAAFPPEKPEPLASTQTGTPFSGIASLSFSPDGKSLASTFANFVLLRRTGILIGRVQIFSVVPVEPEKPAPEKPARHVRDVSFSPDGKKYLAVVGGKVDVSDAETGKQLYSVTGEAAQFSADGKKLFVMADKVLECDAATGKILATHDRPKTKWGWHAVAFSPDGRHFAVHFGTHARVYVTATGKELPLDKQIEQPGSFLVGAAAEELRWSPDGKAIIAGGIIVSEGQVGAAVWEVESGRRRFVFNATEERPTGAAAFTPDWGKVAVASGEVVELWVLEAEAKKNPERKYRAAGPVTAVAFSKDGKLLAVGARLPMLNPADKPPPVIGHKSVVQIFDATSAEELKRLDGFEGVNHMAPTKLPVTALAFAPDGKKLVAGTGLSLTDLGDNVVQQAGEVKVFDLSALAEKPAPALNRWRDVAILEDHGRLVNGVAISPDGKSFAAATEGNVTCWDAATRKKLWSFKPAGANSPVRALAYSPGGDRLCIAGKIDVMRLDAKTGREEPWTDDNAIWFGKVHAMAYSPNGELLATSDGYLTRLRRLGRRDFDVTLGARPKESEPAPERPAGLAWSKDGKRLALIHSEKAGGKWAVTLWEWERKENNTTHFAGHDDPVTAVAWSKDGKLIASGDEKGVVLLWDVETGKQLWRKKFVGRDMTDGRINALAFSPADNTLAAAVSMGSGKQPERVALLPADTGKDAVHIMRPWRFPVSSVAWSGDGKFLVTGCGAAGRAVAQTEPAVGEVVVWELRP